MSPEQESNNIASWNLLAGSIEEYPESAYWTPWKLLARKFVGNGIKVGLNHYFRAGRSMNRLVFSTLDRHGLRHEPRVTVDLHPADKLCISYIDFSRPERLEYTLEFEPAFATFRRFLNHLWTETIPDPLPEELRVYSAPTLSQFVE